MHLAINSLSRQVCRNPSSLCQDALLEISFDRYKTPEDSFRILHLISFELLVAF